MNTKSSSFSSITRKSRRTARAGIVAILLTRLLLPNGGNAAAMVSYTRTIPHGLSGFCLDYPSTSNSVAQLLPDVPEGLLFYKFDPVSGRYRVNQFRFGAWGDTNQTIIFGEGAFIQNPSNAFVVHFMGVANINPPPAYAQTNWTGGLRLLGAWPEIPDAGRIVDVQEGDELYRLDADGTFSSASVYFGGLGWFPIPELTRGESYFQVRSLEQIPASAVYIDNYVPYAGIDAPARSTFGCGLGSNIVAQLYVGGPGAQDQKQSVGKPINFLDGGFRGYLHGVDPEAVVLLTNGFLEGWAELRFWDGRYASNYESAEGRTFVGRTSGFRLASQQSLPPLPPQHLTGLQPSWSGPLTPFPIAIPNSNPVALETGPWRLLATFVPNGLEYLFQWQREAELGHWFDLTGATNIDLVLESLGASDSGRYRLKTSYDCASSTTDPIALEVVARPRLSLSVTNRLTNRWVLVSLTGDARFGYELQRSTNLFHWETVTNLTNSVGPWSWLETNTTLAPQIFYRASTAASP